MEFLMGNVDKFSSVRSHQKYLFQRYHMGTVICNVPVDSFIFSLVLKPDRQEGAFQTINLGNFSYV